LQNVENFTPGDKQKGYQLWDLSLYLHAMFLEYEKVKNTQLFAPDILHSALLFCRDADKQKHLLLNLFRQGY
jgi:hypothetical protein